MNEKATVEQLTSAQKVRKLREKTGLTQLQFSQYFGIPKRTYEDWETARRKMPDYLFRLMEYKLYMEGLITEKEEEEN